MPTGHYNVAPRYTPGSPAMVSRIVAERVAAQEQEAYQQTLTGVYGQEALKRAVQLGLDGIVELLVERRNGWDVTDLITDKIFRREIVKANAIRIGDLVRSTLSATAHIEGPFKVLEVKPSKLMVVVGHKPNAYYAFTKSDLLQVERPLT